MSQSGAKKKLPHTLNIDGLRMVFDNSPAQLCRGAVLYLGRAKHSRYGLGCLNIKPTIMSHHRARGLISGDSDIQSYRQGRSVREGGMTEHQVEHEIKFEESVEKNYLYSSSMM